MSNITCRPFDLPFLARSKGLCSQGRKVTEVMSERIWQVLQLNHYKTKTSKYLGDALISGHWGRGGDQGNPWSFALPSLQKASNTPPLGAKKCALPGQRVQYFKRVLLKES